MIMVGHVHEPWFFNTDCRQICGFQTEKTCRACTETMLAEQRRARAIGFVTEIVTRTFVFEEKRHAEHVFSIRKPRMQLHFP